MNILRRQILKTFLFAGCTSHFLHQMSSTVRSQEMRSFPLFKNEADARAVIKRYCIVEADEPISEADAELLIRKLRTQFWIAPLLADEKSQFRTHFGGAPFIAKDTEWPVRPPALHAEAFMNKLFPSDDDATWIKDYLKRPVPFEFIGQIDLEEAAQHPEVSDGLPKTGRLYFFWDGVVGTYVGGAAACRVIWDDADDDELAEMPIPSDFDILEQGWAAEQQEGAKSNAEKMLKTLPDSIKFMRENGVDEIAIKAAAEAIRKLAAEQTMTGPGPKKPFIYPNRRMKLEKILQLTDASAAETMLDVDLRVFLPGISADPETDLQRTAVFDCYTMLTSNDTGPFAGTEHVEREARRMRFLGSPFPEQSDPRYDAIDTTGYPTEGGWPATVKLDAATKAIDWRLLLQVSVAALSQQQSEGSIYFLIHKEDLARHDFSKVQAYHQQT